MCPLFEYLRRQILTWENVSLSPAIRQVIGTQSLWAIFPPEMCSSYNSAVNAYLHANWQWRLICTNYIEKELS